MKQIDSQATDSQRVDSQHNGWDIVIGNPPYIRQEEIKHLKPQLQKAFSIYKGTSDIYTYFYELGFKILKSSGILSFITSNKWARGSYGETLREFVLQNTQILSYIDLNGVKVFDKATVDTSILSFKKLKANKESEFSYLALDNERLKECNNDLTKLSKEDFSKLKQSSLSKQAFIFADEKLAKLKAKIEKIGTPLKDWDISINYGIKTGYNEAFIIDSAKREEILELCDDSEASVDSSGLSERQRTNELIKPILRGRDIKRYSYEWAGLWIIGTFPALKLDIDEYPSVKNYLSTFLPRIEQSGKKDIDGIKGNNARKKTSNKWFETQDNIAYYEEFAKPKIAYPETTQGAYFVCDNTGFFIDKTAFILVCENLKYLQGLLSSKLITYYYKFLSKGCKLGTNGYQYNKHALETIPLPQITESNQTLADEIIALVEQILESKAKDSSADTSNLESKIDSLVYRLYNLTESEIQIIQGE
ncbi:Eco57I restriction-modification methylase domain-containing protein [uncultured Helicobacter sp.]|uniref:Eco57I restriction-modification methylase domain-containing protein n=1 Tax=uncultured Helicobacter sp. TaxID=175537 RepID=UPI00374F721D